jgi:hypothetical protein
MWWFIMVLMLVILALFGEVTVEKSWRGFLFEVRLKSEWPRFNWLIFKIWKTQP